MGCELILDTFPMVAGSTMAARRPALAIGHVDSLAGRIVAHVVGIRLGAKVKVFDERVTCAS